MFVGEEWEWDAQGVEVDEWFVHPMFVYDPSASIRADLAMLHLSEALPYPPIALSHEPPGLAGQTFQIGRAHV